MMQPMTGRVPLSALLSFALVAFTIETDNEAEHRVTHRTTRPGKTGAAKVEGAWLTSLAMWFNCLQWIPEQGIALREVERLARTRTNWDGMRRWGHIRFERDPDDDRPKPPASALLVRATANGRQAQYTWRVLIPEIEARWRDRFGAESTMGLRRTLTAVASQFDVELPDCMPILKYGLWSEAPRRRKPSPERPDLKELPLPALLARVLLGFALEFERESPVSLAICANVLRVIEDDGTAARDLPRLSGVSKEGLAMALGFLVKRGFAVVQPESPGSRMKRIRLKSEGVSAQSQYGRLALNIERRWSERYGTMPIEGLRGVLERMAGDGTRKRSPLFAGLEPYAEGWRAALRGPETLPHYPMVLHRGGYPDGS
jgi:hypothetical protein